MRYSFVFFIVLLSGIYRVSIGQSVGIRGWISEEVRGLAGQVFSDKGGAVPYAHVFFIHGKDTIPMVCDAVGTFSWQTNKLPDSLQIRVTAVGYQTLESRYFPKTQGNRLSIRLQQEVVALNEVIVTAKKVYMVVKGDTLEYKAESFKTLEGDFIGNLLRKLPGVSYEEGILTVNGEPIYRIYVNGEDFGSKNTILKNLRADNVKDIQVYDERNKEDQAAGMKYGRRETVMNVVTKQKVDRWKDWRNGNFLLGTGWDISNNSTSRFKQKLNLKFDYNVPLRNPNGDPQKVLQKSLILGGEYTNIGTANDVQKSNFTLRYANMGANKKFVYPNKLYYSTQNTFTNKTDYTHTIDERVYFPTSDYASRSYEGHKVGENRQWDFDSKHSFAYKRINWSLGIQGKKMEQSRSSQEHSETNDMLISAVNMQYRMKDVYSAGMANLSFPLMESVRLRSSLGLSQGKRENQQIDTLPESSRYVHLEEKFDRQSAYWEGGISFSETLSLFRIGIGYTYKSSMDREDGKSVNQFTNSLDTNGTRDYTFYQQGHSLAGSLNVSLRNIYIDGNIEVQRLCRNHVERFPYRIAHRDDFWPFMANLNVKGKYSPTFNWDLTYRLMTQLPFIPQTRRSISTSNPMFLYAGNPNLKPEKQHHWLATVNLISVSNAAHFRGSVSYDLMVDAIVLGDDYFQKTTYLPEYDYTVMAGATLTTPKNTKSAHSFNVSAFYSKHSGLLESKLDFEGNYYYRKKPTFSQGQANDYIINQGIFFFRLETAFSRKVEFIWSTKTSVLCNRSDLDKTSTILEQRTSLTFRTSLIPKFRVSSTFSYDYTKNYATEHENGLADLKMEIGRDIGRFASLKLEGINLLDRQNGVSYGKSATYTSRTEMARTGCYVMLTFTQKLK